LIDLSKMLQIEEFSEVIPGAASTAYTQEGSDKLEATFLLKGINLDHEGGITTKDMDKVHLAPAKNAHRYLLKAGDVVVMARGSAIRVALADSEVEAKQVIASANFLIIRPDVAKVLPEVLVAYLHSDVGKSALVALSSGAAIQHVPTSKLRSLKVPVPSMEQQKKIAEIFYASNAAYETTIALAEQQKKTSMACMLDLMMGDA